MGGIGETALMRKSRDRNVCQRRLPQQVSKQFDTQMKDMTFERGRRRYDERSVPKCRTRRQASAPIEGY